MSHGLEIGVISLEDFNSALQWFLKRSDQLEDGWQMTKFGYFPGMYIYLMMMMVMVMIMIAIISDTND